MATEQGTEITVEEVGGRFRHSVKSTQPPRDRQLRAMLLGCNSSHWVQILEVLEMVCGTDRQFEKARSRALKLMNSAERGICGILEQHQAEENGNGIR